MRLNTILTVILLSTALRAQTEQPRDQKAAAVLPPAIVSGKHSQVLDLVESDGYLNLYTLKTKFGKSKVVSTATLYERAHEYDAIAQMDKLRGSQEFAKAVKAQAGKVVEGGVNLVTDPLGTTKKAASGVGRFFSSVGSVLGGDGARGGDGTLSEASGFSKTKRAYARHFGVDPYSRNQDLQDTLKDISRAGFLGGTLTSLGLGAVGGAPGVAITVASTTQSLADMVTTKSPQEVSDYNRDLLGKMGVNDDLVDLFMRNDKFTVTEQTAIVMALNSMARTQNRQAYVKFAVLTDNYDMAAFRRRQIEMYAAYDQKVGHIAEFRYFDQFAAARLEDGSLLMMAPVDTLLWTSAIANYVGNVDQKVSAQPAPRKLLWLSGSASALAAQNLSRAGWQLQQKAGDKLK